MMNLEVPYEKLGIKNVVEYIPLKLALNDLHEEQNNSQDISSHPLLSNFDNLNNAYYNDKNNSNNINEIVHIILISLLTLFCILVLLYAIYYFIILRGRQNTIARKQPILF
ncbi:ac78 [Erannis ankeraria nucleopolyhedrovirus]|uniref:ac78 n=1 Tax=Erannis ankeraria nucleopolyhedrovirus TaxID=2913600 RepID=UPI0011799F49|nr:ac78 [Erannis ankeraria nucleopolyhedrovirus]UJZ89024.1 ac78 [Erannis ankeraria nucleopolyhedrovirus]